MKTGELTEKQREKLSKFGVNTWFVMELLEVYKNNRQEEPQNMGALELYVLRLKRDIKENQKLFTVSREESASPAPGFI